MPHLNSKLLVLALTLAFGNADQGTRNEESFIPELQPLTGPAKGWPVLPANRNYGLFDRPAAAPPGVREPAELMKRQTTPPPASASPSALTSASAPAPTAPVKGGEGGPANGGEGGPANGGGGLLDYPTLQASYSEELLSSISSLDSSLDAEISSITKEMTTGACITVTGAADMTESGSQVVTICGPTAASAPPRAGSNNAAPTARAFEAGIVVGAGLLGAMAL